MANWTQTSLDALNLAIAQGVREVWYGDKRVVYQSLEDMLKIKDLIEVDLGLKARVSGRTFGSFNKGLNNSPAPDNRYYYD